MIIKNEKVREELIKQIGKVITMEDINRINRNIRIGLGVATEEDRKSYEKDYNK